MDKKTIGIVAVVVVIIAALWFMSGKKQGSDENSNVTPSPTPSMPQVKDEPNPPAAMPEGTNTWEGTLKTSDNKAKGNLMLQTKDRVVYIKTSRDFSSLIGKEVTVTYNGTLDSFILGSIVAK